MYSNLNDFLGAYAFEAATTQRVLSALSNEKLGHEKAPGDTPIHELAWHIATAPAYMINHEGAEIPFSYTPPAGLDSDTPPSGVTVEQLVAEHKRVSDACIAAVKEKLADADLTREATWFGYTLPLGVWLNMIVNHEVHHRGQLTAMMRNAGLKVPGCYGPNKEEYEEFAAKKAAAEAAG